MNRFKLFVPVTLIALGIAIGTLIAADAPKDPKAFDAKPPEFKLPPGWTEKDIEAFMVAATPGKNHEFLVKGKGTWKGKNTMWMFPGAEPMVTEATSTVTPIMDGRFVQLEMKGEMPGMGPYHGLAITGYDNVSQKFTMTWIDNHGTGMATGTGTLSADQKRLTWEFTYNCPITKKPVTMRQIETITGADTKTVESWGAEPKSGKEFKMMVIEFKRVEFKTQQEPPAPAKGG